MNRLKWTKIGEWANVASVPRSAIDISKYIDLYIIVEWQAQWFSASLLEFTSIIHQSRNSLWSQNGQYVFVHFNLHDASTIIRIGGFYDSNNSLITPSDHKIIVYGR